MMGGLRKYMPLTYCTFFASTLAIAGCLFTSGFFSKDEILYRAWVDHTVNFTARLGSANQMSAWIPPPGIGPAIFVVGVLAATMTAFYMFRALFLTFWGEFRGWTVGRPSEIAREEALHAPRTPRSVMRAPASTRPTTRVTRKRITATTTSTSLGTPHASRPGR